MIEPYTFHAYVEREKGRPPLVVLVVESDQLDEPITFALEASEVRELVAQLQGGLRELSGTSLQAAFER